MTTLYRSPNVKIDAAEWYITVETHRGRPPRVCYRFRTSPNQMWQRLINWPGRLPKGLRKYFWRYRSSVNAAIVGAGGTPLLAVRPITYVSVTRRAA